MLEPFAVAECASVVLTPKGKDFANLSLALEIASQAYLILFRFVSHFHISRTLVARG